jgi:hypothetical protein
LGRWSLGHVLNAQKPEHFIHEPIGLDDRQMVICSWHNAVDFGNRPLSGIGENRRQDMTNIEFWIIQVPGWLLVLYLVVAQCISAFDYSLGVRMGTQEPAERITDVGVAFFKGFAGADLVYAPMLAIGLVGHSWGAAWSGPILGAALGITVYWPIVCLRAVRAARGTAGWDLPKEAQYWVVLPCICLWGTVAMTVLVAQ